MRVAIAALACLLAGACATSRPAEPQQRCSLCLGPVRGSDACMTTGVCSQCSPPKADHRCPTCGCHRHGSTETCPECTPKKVCEHRCPTCGAERKPAVCPTCGANREDGR